MCKPGRQAQKVEEIMSNNGILDVINVRETVANSFVHQMLNSTPERQEKILRMLINRMSRARIDILFIAQSLYSDEPPTRNTIAEDEA